MEDYSDLQIQAERMKRPDSEDFYSLATLIPCLHPACRIKNANIHRRPKGSRLAGLVDR
ncbi:hypothetical protein EYZ11_003464 [Aspergillus tanneri]|uniref:Uncharacterized protein n=1 Tax=Aspergillus tanneri TaxID=1220188 RepID=A0A4S3JN75_9EURO|nr:hypothetical protein EYZ11_003464 [Aspergillus tanneri]